MIIFEGAVLRTSALIRLYDFNPACLFCPTFNWYRGKKCHVTRKIKFLRAFYEQRCHVNSPPLLSLRFLSP